jgi:uncharacterized protein
MPTISLTSAGTAYTQNFNALSNTAASTTNELNLDPQPLPGWFMLETGAGARDNDQYGVDTGGSNTGDTYSYGAAGNTDRALGALQSGTLIPVFGAQFTNDTGQTITELVISYTGEQWRISNISAARDDRLDFQLSLNATDLASGTWTDVNALDFTNPIKTNASAISLDGNGTANRTAVSHTITGLSIAPGATFWIRWSDLNASGADDGLAIDDFSLTPVAAAPALPTLNISDVTRAEGTTPGTTDFTFSVTLTAPAGAGGVTFDIATADGTAQDDNPVAEDNDYVAQALTGQSIPMGSTGPFNFTVTINNDNIREGNETFFVNVTNITGAAAGDTQGTGTLTDDDTPALSIDNVSMTEGDSGTVTYSFTVSLNQAAPFGGVTFDIATADNSATTADGDYVGRTLTSQTIAAGLTSYTFEVTVNGDAAVEPDELFLVNVTNVTGATVGDGQGVGTITNNDVPPTPAASIGDATIVEGDRGVSYLSFTVTLAQAPSGPVTIDYATSNGTATAGSDYLATSGQLSFAAGETTATVRIPIIGDENGEGSEAFTVTLSNPSGATLSDATATGTITDNDGKSYFSLAGGSFEERWTDTSRINTTDNWDGVPYIIGYLGDIDSGSPTAVDPRSYTGPALGAVDVIPNLTATTSTSGGVGEFQLTDPTIGLQGSGSADAPSIVLFMDSSGRSDIRLQANLRDIDTTGDNAAQPINVQYRTSPTGDWINVPGGYFTDVTTGSSATQVTALDILLPAGANNSPTLQIRILTTNAASNDEWVGIDDIVVTSQPGGASVSIADAAVYEGSGGTTPISFSVTRSGDTSLASSVDWQASFGGGPFDAESGDFAPGETFTGTVAFAPDETVATITLDIQADANPEGDDLFSITLSNPVNTAIGDGTAYGSIVNDDGPPPLLTISDPVVTEGNAGTSVMTFTVTRSGGTGAFTVDYHSENGTATAGSDYVAASGTLSFAEGENTKTVEVTVNGDTLPELSETVLLQLSNPTGFALITDATGTGTISGDDPILISQIQGSAYFSPVLAAQGINNFNIASTGTVIVQAIVTAVDNDGTRQGFYITEESADWDADVLTSEGIFVSTRNDFGVGLAVSGVNVGDLVTVTAQVMEYQAFSSMPKTILFNPTSVFVNTSGNPLPTVVLDASRPIPNSIFTGVTPDFTDSADGPGDSFDASLYGISFWETVESMLVTIPDLVAADGFVSTSGGQPIFQAYSTVHADADQLNSRGGYTTAGDPPLSPPDTADTDDGTIQGGRHIHDGDVNPDIIEIDFSGFAIDAPAGLIQALTMGDELGDVTGIVEFDFTDRKLFVMSYDSSQFVDKQPAQETTTLGSGVRDLTIATFNVENLDPGDGAARFAALANVIATNLNAPDIISVEEMQDNNGATNNGTVDASLSWQMLVDALNAAVPGAAYQWVDQAPVNNSEGGEPGGNIRVGFLYNTNRVQLGDLPADATIAERRQYTDRIGDGVRDAGDLIGFSDDMIAGINPADWAGTRLSLLAQFTFLGETIYVAANHFPAKGGSGDFWQLNQDLESGQPANSGWDKRNAVSADLYAMLDHIESNAPGVGIAAAGDFNDFYFARPLEVATGYVLPDGGARSGGARFDNLTVTELTEAERYTYTFDGRSQAIDHIIVNSRLSSVASYDVVHLNTGYNASGTGPNADPSLSDHDPAVASFDFAALINDPPIVDLNGADDGTGAVLPYTENDGVAPIAPDATVTDEDSADFEDGVLTVEFSGGVDDTNDLLRIGAPFTVGEGGELFYNETQVGTAVGGNGGSSPLTVTFNASATPEIVQALVRAVGFVNFSEAPLEGERTLVFTLTDGDGATSTPATAVVTVTSVEDAAVANDDHVFAPEDGVLSGSVFADNGHEEDLDADGPAFEVISVNGQTANVGQEITLASGARLRVNADGTFTYDATGLYDQLPEFETAEDQFSYAITGGDSAAVTVTITGANDRPVVTVSGGGIRYREGEAPKVIDPAITVGDPDDTALVSGTVAITANFRSNQDVLAFTNNDATAYGDIAASYDSATGILSLTSASGTATLAQWQAALRAVTYSNSSDDPSEATRTISFTVNDGDAVSNVGNKQVRVGETVPPPDIPDDLFFPTEGDDIFDLRQTGIVDVKGLGGNDGFIFGASFTVDDKVDGGAGNNDQVSLQGSYDLTFKASNLVNVETLLVLPGFDYDLTTIDANVPAGGRLQIFGTTLGADDNLSFDGSAETDGYFIIYGGAGVDTLTGGSNSDGFYFGPGNFSSADTVHGGPGVNDQLGLDGHYTMTIGGNFDGIETLVLYRGPAGDLNRFDLTSVDAMVAAGQRFTVFGSTLGTDLVFSGSAETDGSFRILGGGGNDSLTGGAGDDILFGGLGADTLTGGPGSDSYLYQDPGQSTGASRDSILGFAAGDKIDLSGIDANGSAAGEGAFSFVGAAAFSGVAGELRAVQSGGSWIIEGDVNGDGVADLLIAVTTAGGYGLTGADFNF